MRNLLKIFYSFSFLFISSTSAFSNDGKEYFKDKDGFFFYIGIDVPFRSINLVWDEVSSKPVQNYVLERSDDGMTFLPVITQSADAKPKDVMQMSEEEQFNIQPINNIFYTTEAAGRGRFIYNELLPDKLIKTNYVLGRVVKNNVPWDDKETLSSMLSGLSAEQPLYYRIKIIYKDGTFQYSGTRSVSDYLYFIIKRGLAKIYPDGALKLSSRNEIPAWPLVNSSNPSLNKKDSIVTLVACPPVNGPPPCALATGQSNNYTGTCCTYKEEEFRDEQLGGTPCSMSNNGAGYCTPLILDCPPSSSDPCCAGNSCSHYSVCGCKPWECCVYTKPSAWYVTQSTNLTPAALSTSQTNASCNAQCNGTASVSATGGTGPFTYTWSPNVSSSSSANNLCAGSYNITVTDATGCVSVTSVTISQPSALATSTSSTNAVCGQSNGSASVTVSGGSPSYTYSWAPSGGNSSSANNLAAGNYTVTVSDANGCPIVATVAVNSTGTANAVFNVNTVCLGQPTNFTDQSTSTGTITGWNWNFGDGNTSVQQNPTHTYTTSGTYTATLTVTDNNGCVSTTTNIVTINPQPVANFSSTTVCLGNPTQFSDLSTGGGISWSWNFGDGNTSTLQNPSNTYAAAGNYTATVVVTGSGGCSSTVSFPVTVYPQPAAVFSATTVCLGNPTQFTDQSTGGATAWSWNFGDGNTSTQQSPSHSYTASGTYTATLNVSASPGGCTSTATQVVTVNPQPAANFSSTSVCITNPTQFTDLSTGGGTSWSWNFGDGNTSTLQNPSNTYAAAGNYTVTLTVTGPGGCTSTIIQPVTVYSVANAAFSSTTVCINTPPTLFTDQSTGASTWIWDFGDGSPFSNVQSPSHTYSASGTYSVTLMVASGNGCADTITQVITVNPTPAAAFNATTVCFNNPTVFTDNSSGTPIQWAWDFGDGNTDVIQNPSHTYNTAGSYTATLIVTNASGCKDTISVPVLVNPLPMASFSSATVCIGNASCFTDLTNISSGNITGWSWNFGDPNSGAGNISNLQNPCHTYTTTGTFNVILTATSNNGCQSTVNQTAVVNPPPVAAFTASTVCLNAPTVFTNTSQSSILWSWNFGDGNTSTSQNPVHTYLGYGTYIVTLIVTSGGSCLDTVTDTITVNPLPIVNFNADSVCLGQPTSFSDLSFIPSGNITIWNWNFGDPASGANNTSIQQNPTHVFSSAGNFNVTLTVSSNTGCISTLALQVIVYGLPTADFSYAPASPIGLTDVTEFSDLSIGGAVSWAWQFGDGDSSVLQSPNHLYTDTGIYVVVLSIIDNHGCVDTVFYPLEIQDYTFYIPNAFTPNGDGKNDFFFGVGIGIIDYEMFIFDRWGNRIFYCKSADLPQQPPCLWNGKVDGGFSDERVQEDVYVWKVHLTNIFKKNLTYVGTVTVVR